MGLTSLVCTTTAALNEARLVITPASIEETCDMEVTVSFGWVGDLSLGWLVGGWLID